VVEIEETEVIKKEIEKMITRTNNELSNIKAIVSTEGFDTSNKNYDLKFHYRVLNECISMLREMLLNEKWY
jgi:hypothetical protein